MGVDARTAFIRRWFDRAHEPDQDSFDRFFAIWIGLIVAAKQFCSHRGRCTHGSDERGEIADYFKAAASLVNNAQQSRLVDVRWLANRRGPMGSPVIDVVGLRDPHPERRELWCQHWLDEAALEPAKAAECFAHVAYDIRNNVFHGQKLYDDTADREVVAHLWPVLAAVISRIEGA